MGEFDWNDMFGGSVRSKDSIVDKIRKLQALSHSSNEHEAALAASKMQELLFKHNLSVESLLNPADYIKDDVKVSGKAWQENLLAAIARNNFCKPVLNRRDKTIHIIGKRENIQAVTTMYNWLTLKIEQLASAGYFFIGEDTGETIKTWKNGFRNGAVNVLETRLRQQREMDVAKIAGSQYGKNTGTEIILKMKNELSVATREFFPNLYTTAHRESGSYSNGFAAGRTAGSRMSLGKTGGNLK